MPLDTAGGIGRFAAVTRFQRRGKLFSWNIQVETDAVAILGALRERSALEQSRDYCSARADSEFREDPPDMCANRPGADAENVCDYFV